MSKLFMYIHILVGGPYFLFWSFLTLYSRMNFGLNFLLGSSVLITVNESLYFRAATHFEQKRISLRTFDLSKSGGFQFGE
jgi:hypothetical protein